MKTVVDFFNEFLEAEYHSTVSIFTKEMSDEESKELTDKTKSFLHSIVKYQHERSGAEFDEDMVEFSEINKNNVIKRHIFLVKEYQNATYGEALSRVIIGNKLYGFYCSYNMKTRKEIGYSQIFFVTDTDEGFKIVYLKRFLDGKWALMHGYEPMQITNTGHVVEVCKVQAPVDAVSLARYEED
ncbi:hypothetical protein [Cohnella herbarum]|uniref:Uncharacterized protein n=1 Tax=Cohnella herbarum TaxID=2728023 RepID=A0A7Z2ZN02_9BACL|nr:hypothetical protein [Cohnella herbarum]QJD85688.1 hypothetical protein HH215_22540 [Cohnella herbarum]